MKHSWLAYVVVALLAAGAGVAIAGLPDDSPTAATITTPTTDGAIDGTVLEVTVPETVVETTVATTPTTPETTAAATTTVAPTTTQPETDDTVPADLPDRSELDVTAANGANVAGAALRMATQLEEIGYVDVAPRNGTQLAEFTTVYFAEGFDAAAQRLAEDLDLADVFVAPIENSPTVVNLPDAVDLVVYIGLDRA